jgi:uncharacterized protein (TIGR02118 family)
MKLVALYRQPEDPESFDSAYFNAHIPLIKKVPGLLEMEIFRFTRTLMGDGFYMMNVMHFMDQDSLKSAMRSPEMAAAGENLNTFADGLVTLMYAE